MLSWVFFKVTSSDSATAILKGMCGLIGISSPEH